jgi:hypothetical protein
MADQDRPGDQLERFTPGTMAEGACSHVGDVEAAVQLDERLVTRADVQR